LVRSTAPRNHCVVEDWWATLLAAVIVALAVARRSAGVGTVRVEPGDTSAQASFTSRRPLDYVPGIALLIAVGVLGKYTQIWWNALARHEHWTVPDIEYVLWAVVIGLLITNTLGLALSR
jgi:Conserved hypothetical protein 698